MALDVAWCVDVWRGVCFFNGEEKLRKVTVLT